jgi:hypothetical protein
MPPKRGRNADAEGDVAPDKLIARLPEGPGSALTKEASAPIFQPPVPEEPDAEALVGPEVAASSAAAPRRREVGPGVAQSSSSSAAAAAAPLLPPGVAQSSSSQAAVGDPRAAAPNPLVFGTNVKLPTPTIWTQILGDAKLSPVDEKEAIEILQKLAYFDSIHDFWKERGKGKGVTDEDEDEPDDVDDSTLEKVQETLTNIIRKYQGVAAGTPMYKILETSTGSLVSTTSLIEDKVLAYFKKKHKPFNEPERTITVTEILKDWVFEKDKWDKYSAAIKTLPNTLEIVIDPKVKNIKSLTDAQRGQLGFFLLAFMNPDINPGSQDAYMTFDMAPRDIGKIFERFTQVKNAIYPQNVADSASTSFSALQGRNVFFRANYEISGTATNVVEMPIRSNAFTKDKYELKFVDTGFSNKNKFAFSIVIIEKATKKVVGKIPFGGGNEQGPSVNYLMDLIARNNRDKWAAADAKKKSKVASLLGISVADAELLFDIKRLGDQEQMLVRNAYGITGDRFAAAFRRILRKAGIFHSIKGFRVWRGKGAMTEAELEAQTREFRKAQIIEKLKIVSNILRPEGPFNTILRQLTDMRKEVSEGAEFGVIFSDILRFEGNPITKDAVAEKYTEIASTFTTYILRERMKDILKHIDGLIAKVKEIGARIRDFDAAACTLKQPTPSAQACPPGVSTTPTAADIDGALDTLEKFIVSVKELDALDISFKRWDNSPGGTLKEVDPIYAQLFADVGGSATGSKYRRLLKGTLNFTFNFRSSPFLSESGLAVVVGRLLRLATSKRPNTVVAQINLLLADYFKARDAILARFFDETIKKEIEALTDITTGMDPVRVVAFPAEKQGIITVIEETIKKYEPEKVDAMAAEAASAAAVPAAEEDAELGGGAKQTGGADGDPRQFRDLHDLFVELCLEAKVALENADGVQVSTQSILAPCLNADTPIEAKNAVESALQKMREDYHTQTLVDLEARWVLGVDDLRTQAEDDYGTPFEETATTALISFILSFRTEGGSITSDGLFDVTSSDVAKRRELVKFNDVQGILLTQVPVEGFVLKVLRLITETLLGKDSVVGEMPGTKYAAPAAWKNDLPNLIEASIRLVAKGQETLPREVTNLLVAKGGGLEGGDGSESNDDVSSSGGVLPGGRRGLYAGLRKRSGSGGSSGVRE